MGSDLRWIMQGRVLYSRYFGDVSMEQVKEGAAAFITFLDELSPTGDIHVVYDNRQQTKGPTNMAALRSATQGVFAHPRIGWNILIIDNPLNKFLASIVVQIGGARWRVVGSHEEALQTLQRLDLTLPSLPVAPPLDETPIMHFD